jgi:hypothetical protein
MGRVESEVVKDEQFENFRNLHIQWWVPVKKKQGMIENCIMIVR